jgi:hypothetical protein
LKDSRREKTGGELIDDPIDSAENELNGEDGRGN